MINWDAINYDVERSNRDFSNLEINTTSVDIIKPMDELIPIREKLIEARNLVYDEYNLDTSNSLDYQFDLEFGMKVYNILNKEIGFTNRIATNDDVWRYLSVKVVPDIVHARWGMKPDHFYKMPRRIWLKTIWWYIHLAWTGNSEETFSLLKTNTTDTILQLVERPGIGYHIELYREIMKQYAERKSSGPLLFRKILKLNTARLLTTMPEMVPGGIPTYVEELFLLVEGQNEHLQ